jgi:NTE family protein
VPREKDNVRFLKSLPLFERVPPGSQAFADFAAEIQSLPLKKGQSAYKQGAASGTLYIVRDGEIHIRARTADTSRLVAVQSRGSLFGEVSFLSGESHSSDAEASLDSTILVIPGAAFFRLLASEPSVGEGLARLLSQRMRNRMKPDVPTETRSCVSVLYPDLQKMGSELCAELAAALSEDSADPVIVLSWNRASVWKDRPAREISSLLKLWPQGMDKKPADNGPVDVFFGLPADRDRIRLREILPGLIALLKKYYSTVILDPGCDPGDDLSSAALDQSDRLVLVQSCRDPHVLRTRAFGEAISWCAQLDVDFFERAILVTHERPGDGPLQHPMEERFERHIRLRGVSDRLEETDRTTRSGVQRIARAISGTSRALCLGGGGARALAHVGVLEVFEENGIEFDAVAGTSMGAVVGAAHCLGLSAEEIEYNVRRLLPDSNSILDRTLPLISFFTGRKLNNVILGFFQHLKFEDLALPFICNAADLNSGKIVVFDRGFLASAIRASVSIPGVFPPIRIGDYTLVDGAVLNNLPGDILRARGYNVVVGVNVSPVVDAKPVQFGIQSRKGFFRGVRDYFSIPPILRIINRSIAIESRELLKIRMEMFDYLLSPEVAPFDVFDFDRKKEIMEAGRNAARAHLGAIKEVLARQKIDP